MGAIDRRDFLVRSGMAISAAVLAAEIPLPKVFADSPPLKLDSWQAVREQFQLSRDCIHLAGFFLASHPIPLRSERRSNGTSADWMLILLAIGSNTKKSRRRLYCGPRQITLRSIRLRLP